jgi:hypothetical protein
MKKLMRRIATTGVSAAVAGGAVFATGGSAMAASPQTPGRLPGRTAAVATGHSYSHHRTAHLHVDPWVAGQLAMFEPAAAKRLAVYDPWVEDQLAQFYPATR